MTAKKPRVTFRCRACEAQLASWVGRCTSCGEWGTVDEHATSPGPAVGLVPTTTAQPLGEIPVFPPMVVQMISVGESSGALDTMLNKIADFYDDEVDAAIGTMMSLLEPLIMAFLAVVLGGLVVSMYLPVFTLAGGV